MKRRIAGSLLLGLALSAPVWAEKHALLIGISDYKEPKLHLEGPAQDIRVMERVLTEGWGASPQNVRVLKDQEASRGAMLKEIEQLTSRVTAADEVLIYFSGHGTSRYDADNALPIAHGSGAYFPWDGVVKADQKSVMARLLIGNRDLRPRLEKLDRIGAKVLVVADSCFAGNAVRSMTFSPTAGFSPRQALLTITDDIALSGKVGQAVRQPPPRYPYKNISYLSAANSSEKAIDIGSRQLADKPTLDGKPHGAFTDALLRVLTGAQPGDANHDGRLSHDELRQATQAFLAERGFQHTPQLLPPAEDDPKGLRDQALFTPRALPEAPTDSPKTPALRIALATGMADLKTLLRKEVGMQLVGEAEEADVRLRREGGDWLLLAGSGDPIGRTTAGDTGKALARLRQQRWIKGLKWRQVHDNPLGLKLDIVPDQGGNFRYGEYFTLRMAVSKPVWLVLLDIDSEGNLTPLFPYEPEEVRTLAAGEAIYVPHPDPKKSLCIQEPEGTDHLIALAFAERPPSLESLVKKEKIAFTDPALSTWRDRIEAGGGDTAAAVGLLRIIKGDGKCKP